MAEIALNLNTSNYWPHLNFEERRSIAASGPLKEGANPQDIQTARESYLEQCSTNKISSEGCDGFLYQLVMGEKPEETKARLDEAEEAKVKAERAEELRIMLLEKELEPKIREAKKNIKIILGGKSILSFDGENYYYGGVKIKRESINVIIKIWDTLALKLVEHELNCEILELRKQGKETTKPEELLKYLFEKRGKEYKAPEGKCDYSNEIYRMINELNRFHFKSQGGGNAGTLIEYKGDRISGILATFDSKPGPIVKEDMPEKINSEYFKKAGEPPPLITEKDIMSGLVKFDCDNNVYDAEGKKIGEFDPHSVYFNKRFYSKEGEHIGYIFSPPAPSFTIKNFRNEVVLQAERHYEQPDDSLVLEEVGGPLFDSELNVLGKYNYVPLSEAIKKGLVNESAFLGSLRNYSEIGGNYNDMEVLLIYDSDNNVIGFSSHAFFRSVLVYTKDEEGNRLYVAEMEVSGQLHLVRAEDGSIVDYYIADDDIPWGFVECE